MAQHPSNHDSARWVYILSNSRIALKIEAVSCVVYIPIIEGSAQRKRKWLHSLTKLTVVCLKLPLEFCGSSHQFSCLSTDIFEHVIISSVKMAPKLITL